LAIAKLKIQLQIPQRIDTVAFKIFLLIENIGE